MDVMNEEMKAAIIKSDSKGKPVWKRIYDYPPGRSHDVITDDQGGYIQVGKVKAFGDDAFLGDDVFFWKVAETGGDVFEQHYGGDYADIASTVAKTKDNGYVIGGFTYSFGDKKRRKAYLIKVDSVGKRIWEKVYGGRNQYSINSLVVMSNGDIVVVGSTKSDQKDMLVVKFDGQGNAKGWN